MTPYIVAGPCAAENREQILTTAKQLVAVGIDVFRAGVWKPRTSPDTFQGAGDEALLWLQEAKQLTGLPVATEVATPEHIAKAREAGVDVFWIGARTAANPIAVQELTTALRPGDEVLLKNPVNDDVLLWLGNIERLEKAGARVQAVHRGCNHRPLWHMTQRLQQLRPDVPLLLDPSHMSGDANKVPTLCKQATQLGYNGLMIEVHPHPEKALSDSAQQITSEQLGQLLQSLEWGATTPDEAELAWLRRQIDETDDTLWEVILHRLEIARQIGDYKRQRGLPILQSERFAELAERRMAWAALHDLDPETVRRILDALHEESCRQQM